jgi:glycosyltransferase involved in cell wall biosynthesis
MRIAQLCTNVECVPPSGYGGTELVVHHLTEELIKRGHEVTLFASGDSKTKARLISITKQSLRTSNRKQTQWQAFDMRTLITMSSMEREFDIIHNHMGYQALPFLANLRRPCLSTNHNPVKDYCAAIYLQYSQLPYVSISNAYRKYNYADELNYIATIYNGIDLNNYALPKTKGNYLLFIGRIGYDKGTAQAIEIAQALNLPLKIAGKIDSNDKEYFNQRVKPHLSKKIEYVGEIDLITKSELYAGAIAVVYPIQFEEPFGLVMAEALASGTPIMAFDRGSVREILSDNETAVIGSSTKDLIDRFAEIEKIKPETCRERAKSLFSKEQMVTNYEKAYLTLVQQRLSVL